MIFIAHWRKLAARRQEGAGASALFLLGSVASHALLYGIAASAGSLGTPTEEREPVWVEFEVSDIEAEVVRAPEAPLVPEEVPARASIQKKVPSSRKPRKHLRASAVSALTKQEQAPEQETVDVLPSVDDAGVEPQSEDVSPVVVASETTDTQQTTSGPAGLGDGNDHAVDPRVVIRAWMKDVQRSIQRRAIRDYPLAAQRMRLQGNVFIAIDVDVNGRVTNVRTSRASGHSTLDQAAVEAVLALGQVPTPPAEFLKLGRPLTVPVAYRFR